MLALFLGKDQFYTSLHVTEAEKPSSAVTTGEYVDMTKDQVDGMAVSLLYFLNSSSCGISEQYDVRINTCTFHRCSLEFLGDPRASHSGIVSCQLSATFTSIRKF